MLHMTLSAGQHLGDGFGVGMHRLTVVPSAQVRSCCRDSCLQGQVAGGENSNQAAKI